MTDDSAMDLQRIMVYLPHRYPFLLIDRVLEHAPGGELVAIKNVTANEHFFQGHFPGRPVMPGVLVIEAMAQAAGVLAFRTAGTEPTESSTFYFVGIDKARFRAPVVPGDQLVLKARFERRIRTIWRFTTEARVDGKLVASAEMMVAPEGGRQ
ncbi:MAG TPA: 3-hydroxyacyl-ACP dehydratase FabZ [Gammaproteobacteria bacterium]|nr:3-hydroxyacyl-ACP dehydratase FabZ [Gammaproteobacteria bacterium]